MDKQALKRFELVDVLLPERLVADKPVTITRAIRRSIDLLKRLSIRDEWNDFLAYQEAAYAAETRSERKRKILEVLVMAAPYRVNPDQSDRECPDWYQIQIGGEWVSIKVRSTENQRRVAIGTHSSWMNWLRVGPSWFRDVLQPYLELWCFQIPETPAEPAIPVVVEEVINGEKVIKQKAVKARKANALRGSVRKTFQVFATHCGAHSWCWDADYSYAEKRIAELQKQIDAIPTPNKGWTEEELALLGGLPAGSLASLLTDRLPPYIEDRSLPVVVRAPLEKPNPLQAAVMRGLEVLYPNLLTLDVAAWPLQPLCLTVEVEGTLRPVVVVFRSNGKVSKVPRLSHAYGSLNLMAMVNEKLPDSEHPAYLDELAWGADKIVLFDCSSTIFVRTWANWNKTGVKVVFPFTEMVFAFRALRLSNEMIRGYRASQIRPRDHSPRTSQESQPSNLLVNDQRCR